MKISEAAASVLLSDEGRVILATVEVEVEPWCWLEVDVAESEDLGLWIRIGGTGATQLLLLRWECILAVGVTERQRGAVMGLRR
jgi:hypothetical protein